MPRTAAGLDSVKKSRPASTSAGSTLLQQQSRSSLESSSAPHWFYHLIRLSPYAIRHNP